MVDVRLQARVDSGGGFGAIQDTAVVIQPDDVVRFSAPSFVGWTSPAAYFEFARGEYPPGWPCPAGWTDVDGSYRFVCSNIDGFAPPDVTYPSPGGIWGKWRCALVVNGGGQGLEDELFVEIVGPNGTHDIVPGEGEQFGTPGQTYFGPQRENLRLVDIGVAAATGVVKALSWKAPVRGVAAADVPSLAAFTVAQGDVTYAEGERVFLGPNQASNLGTSIGIFDVGVVGGGTAPLTRSSDADTEAKLLGAVFVALEGTKAGKIYKVTNTAITVDSTTITYEEGGLLTTAQKDLLDGATSAASNNALTKRGGSGEAAFAYLYPSGSVPTTGFLRGQSGFVAIATLTGVGSFDNVGFSDDGSDGWKVGNDTRAAGVRLAVKTGGSATVEVNNVVEVTLDAGGVNVAAGNTFQVNGVAHATAATNSSLAFRGSSAELSVGYLYSAGTVSTTGFIRLARNFTAIACKTAASVDHPILVEDNADGFVMGSSTLTAGWTWHAKTGDVHSFKVNNIQYLSVGETGLTLAYGSTIDDAIGGTFAINSPSPIHITADQGVIIQSGGGEDFYLKNGSFVGVYMDNSAVYLASSAHVFTATTVGLFGATPVTKPTAAGSRGGNAALASLLTALANLGLITDSTTA